MVTIKKEVKKMKVITRKVKQNKTKNNHKLKKKMSVIYDSKWKMMFNSVQERKKFLMAIEEAEEDIKQGNMLTSKEMWNEFNQKFNLELER